MKKRPLKELPIKDRLVYVEWEDARGVTQEWTDVEELEKCETCTCISIGLLLVNDNKRVVVLPHLGLDPVNGCGEMTIPRGQVRRMWFLKVGPEAKPL